MEHFQHTFSYPLKRIGVLGLALLLISPYSFSDVNIPTKFTNIGSIANTRHNLTQKHIGDGNVNMNAYRNNYEQVCVYCHTPHAATTQTQLKNAPLWNRTMPNPAGYQTYNKVGTSSATAVSSPGANSLTCLSCHDGTIGVDSIINIPGSGRALSTQEVSQDNSFLNDNWDNFEGADASVHMALDGENKNMGCLACHDVEAGIVGAGAADFSVAALGTDLTNDHPVGVGLPQNAGSTPVAYRSQIAGDFINVKLKEKTGTTVTAFDGYDPSASGQPFQVAFYDGNDDNRLNNDELRFYNTGEGYEVECASCHDPHGVPSIAGDRTSLFNPTFLRVSNEGSAVCLSCHVK
jgi:hypothetical protein